MTLRPATLFVSGMHKLVAACAEGDEVVLGVVSELTPRVDVVNMEFDRAPAALAAPAIPLQYLLAEALIGLRVQPKPRPSRQQAGDAALHMCVRNSCLCAGDRKS